MAILKRYEFFRTAFNLLFNFPGKRKSDLLCFQKLMTEGFWKGCSSWKISEIGISIYFT